MNGCELELEQWSCCASPNKPNSSISKVLMGDTIAMKCEKESEGLLLLKRVEVKNEKGSPRSGKNSSPDTGYESDNFCLRNERDFANSACHFVRPESLPDSASTSTLGSLIVEEVKVPAKIIKIDDISIGNDRKEIEENVVLDLTTTTKTIQLEPKDLINITTTPIDYSLSPADEMNAIMNNEVESLTGVSVLESVLESRPPIDTILSCSDGKLGTHRIVLTAASVFFYELFKSQRLEEIVVVILPDITKKTMTSLLHLAYTGQMIYTEDIQDEIFSAMECLIFGDLKKLSLFPCTINNKGQPPPPAADEIVKDISPEENVKNARNICDDKISDRESLAEITACTSSDATTDKAKNKTVILTCSHCPRTFTKKGSLQYHTTKFHPEEYRATVGEMQMLSFCDICDRQYKTVSRAMFCYNQHGLTRCLTCLGVFPTTEIKDHYTSVHANAEDDDFVVKCRWCSRSVSVKNNLTNISSHSSLHWPGAGLGKRQQEQEPSKIAKGRQKKTSSDVNTRSRKLTPLPSAFESEATKETIPSLKTFSEPIESKKRHRSCSSDEDDFNLSKTLRKTKLQYAKRTGKPVGRGGGLTMKEVTLRTIPNPQANMIVADHGNPWKTKPVDINSFPRVVIKLDSMEKINKMMKKYKNRTKYKRSSMGLDHDSKKNSNVEFSATSGTTDNDSIEKIDEINQEKREELVNDTDIFYSKEIKGTLCTYLLSSEENDGNEAVNNSKNIKVLNTVLEKTEIPVKTVHNASKLSTYPMLYFPKRLNQPPVEDKARKCLPVNSTSSKENKWLVNSLVSVEKSSKLYEKYEQNENLTSPEESSFDMS